MDVALVSIRLLLALVFVVAGVAKLADLAGSRSALAGFGIPERIARPLGTLLPFAELAIAGLLLPASTARAGGLAALALLTLFSAGIAASVARGRTPDCHCFGQLHSEPAGPRTLARNLALAAAAGFVAFAGGDAGPGTVEELGSLSAAAAAAVAAGLALALFLTGCVAVALSLIRQNGRLLLRVEALETALTDHGVRIPQATEAETHGLPVGSPAPNFELPRPGGEATSLNSLLSARRPALLVFTSPDCGPCENLMPVVAAWQKEHAARLAITVISHQAAEGNGDSPSKHGLAEVLIDRDREVSDRYNAYATPSAVLVGPDGLIASEVAAGQESISGLVERALRPVSPWRPSD